MYVIRTSVCHSYAIRTSSDGAACLMAFAFTGDLSVPLFTAFARQGNDVVYDQALASFFAPYYLFVDVLVRVAVNHKVVRESLVTLSMCRCILLLPPVCIRNPLFAVPVAWQRFKPY